jgi:murein L,D-transpeptidase YcbB/YkuD
LIRWQKFDLIPSIFRGESMIRGSLAGCGRATLVAFGALLVIAAAQNLVAQHSATAAGYALTPAAASALRAIANSAHNPDLRWPDFPAYKTEFSKFYESSEYSSLAWIENRKATPQALAVIGLLESADAKGLEPEDYDASRWPARLSNLSQHPSEEGEVSFDTALTVSAMRYVRAVHSGRANPKDFDFELDMQDGPLDLADFLESNVLRSGDPIAEIEKLEPPFPGYRKLLALLPLYEGYAARDDGEKLQPVTKTVLPGQPYAGLPRLGRFLQLIGDISPEAKLDPQAATYSGVFVDGVKHYQDRHGESPTGKLDARTINEMNTPAQARIRQIKLTLERWRWVPHSFPEPPVVVNLPEYRLRAMNADGTVAFYKNVIVGKAYGHKSPMLQEEIQYVVFRPYWNVPFSIQRSEAVPHIEKDPNYIASHNFQVVTSKGGVVTEGVVSPEVLQGLKSGSLMMRQKPGSTNSLGLVKIIFPNPDNVYLHGTDVPELFSQDVRDFSHGCIRVQQPADLVAWILRNNPGWSVDRVKAAMDGDQDNVRVNLTKPIPVLIVYGSAAVNEENQIRFFDDIYGYDAALDKALSAPPQ